MTTFVYDTAEETSDKLAEYITDRIQRSSAQDKRFFLCLSGGKTPQRLYSILALKPIDWSLVQIFFGDERIVPFENEQNNSRMVAHTLLDQIQIPAANFHRIKSELPPDEIAINYEEDLRKVFSGRQHTFDLLIAGLGDDGHTLSLFPDTEIKEDKWVQKTKRSDEQIERITLTPEIVNASAEVIFFVTGEDKADIVKAVAIDKNPMYPASGIMPASDDLRWYTDKSAGKYL